MTWQMAIGVMVVIVVVLVLMTVLDGDPAWLKVLDVLDCCSCFTILVVASMVMLGGLALWHNLLLAEGAGASIITVILLGWAVALRKQFLANQEEELRGGAEQGGKRHGRENDDRSTPGPLLTKARA